MIQELMWMHQWKSLKHLGSFTLKILVNPLHGQHDCCDSSSWVGVVSNISSFSFRCTSKSLLPVGTRYHPDSLRDEVWVEVIILLLCDLSWVVQQISDFLASLVSTSNLPQKILEIYLDNFISLPFTLSPQPSTCLWPAICCMLLHGDQAGVPG